MPLERPCGSSEEEVFVFPTSFAQQRLWFLDQLVSGIAYNVPIIVGLSGSLNLGALEQSFNAIVRRHEVLRTTFGVVEGQPVQMITPHLSVPLPLIDLQQLSMAPREAAAQRLMAQEMQQPFNLAQGPLLRLMLLQLEAAEYVLVINLHHIVFDEWSIGILIRELGLLYTAFSIGKPSLLPELPIQYADFAHWQRQWLQGEVLRSQLSYWKQQLQDLPGLELPVDRPRPLQQSYQGATQLLELPLDLAEALEVLSQQEGATLFMALLAAFQAFLFRYTGQEDIAVGSPIANRNRSDLEGLIGFFANTLVLRLDLSGNPTFRELLGRARQVALAAYAHQDLPFEKLVEELHPERDLSRNPLFQVVFALQNVPMEQLALPGVTLSSLNLEMRTTRFDLELYLWKCSENFRSLWGSGWQQSEGLRGVLVYSTDLFEPSSITRMLKHFQTLLAGAVAHPDTRLSELPLLSDAEQHQLLVAWNQTQSAYPDHPCPQLFEAQVAQNPQAIAVNFGGQPFTYEALNRGSNQLAHYLQKLGVGPEVLVGICMERSSELVAGLLGILKAGGVYVPLDPSYPLERLQFMLEDAQVSVLLTQQWTGPIGYGGTIVCLDRDWQAIAQESEENPPHRTTADNLAYVVYTSGSTGTPKGVAVPHRAVSRLVCNTNYIQLDPTDKVAQCANISFDAATFEIWGALLNGAQLVGISREVILSPQEFAGQIRQQAISVLFLTTALLNQLAREVPAAFRSLRYLLFGGEMAEVEAVQTVLQQGAPEHLLHVYGPTENTTFTSWYPVPAVPEAATSIPIGRAIANSQLYLLDSDLKPVPIGVRGEVYIGGDGLARGYLNRPELTAERFIPNPFATTRRKVPGPRNTEKHSTLGDRLYKTGDLARYRLDGNLEFLGRQDEQIKLRGFRIELGEIAAVLNQHQTVREAVVMVREAVAGVSQCSPRENRRLVAYIVPHPDSRLNVSDLQRYLKAKLPDYMVPSALVVLETLPLTPNGKVDRQALPAPDWTRSESPGVDQRPCTSIEMELGSIWREILGLEQVGIHDNFFESGGHSLLATQLVSRVRNRFQVEVPLRRLFETPTIAGLAAYLEAVGWIMQGQATGTGTTSENREEVEF